jgi:hypothetical protein
MATSTSDELIPWETLSSGPIAAEDVAWDQLRGIRQVAPNS